MNNQTFLKNYKVIIVLLFSLLCLIYYLLHDHSPLKIDDAWFASIIYNYTIHGIETDEVFQGGTSTGIGGVVLFF